VRTLLFRLLDPSLGGAPGSRLMSREMMEPTVALDTVVREQVRPIAAELRAIVAGFLGPRAPEEQVRACGMSIVSQCLFYHQCQPMIRQLFPDLRFTAADIERLAVHITRFSTAGVRAATRAPAPHRPPASRNKKEPSS
jgi:TetR/AcrR family transcriptional regulator, regulator of cefoperazone and chloramphenicol sensitivity